MVEPEPGLGVKTRWPIGLVIQVSEEVEIGVGLAERRAPAPLVLDRIDQAEDGIVLDVVIQHQAMLLHLRGEFAFGLENITLAEADAFHLLTRQFAVLDVAPGPRHGRLFQQRPEPRVLGQHVIQFSTGLAIA